MAIRQDLIETLNHQAQVERTNRTALLFLENLQQQLDPVMQGWTPSGASASPMYDLRGDVNEEQLRAESFKSFYRDPHGRNIIQTPVKFVIGASFLVDFYEKDETKLTKLNKWLRKCQKSLKWFSFFREFVTRSYRDGEVFVRKFANEDGPIKLRFIEPGAVTKIEYDGEDIEVPSQYRTEKFGDIPAEDILHFKSLNVDRNVPRGRPSVESALPYLKKYERWMEARLLLSIVRTSVALVQEVQGNNTDLLRIRSAQTATRQRPNQTDKAKMLQPGTIIRGTPGVQYKMLSPNLDARDAAEDGRTMLIAAGAGQGLPDSFVTMDWQRSNFASSVVAQNPAIRKFEEDQNLFKEPFSDIVQWFLEDGIEKGELGAEDELDFDINFPPLLRRDLAQENTAYASMYEMRALSLHSWALKMGFDPDEEQKFLADEKARGLGPPEPKPMGATPSVGSAPKRVEDRQPRQNRVTGSGESRKLAVTVVPNKDKTNGQLYSYAVEYAPQVKTEAMEEEVVD